MKWVALKRDNIQEINIGKQIYQFLMEFDKICRKMTDFEKKEYMKTCIH